MFIFRVLRLLYYRILYNIALSEKRRNRMPKVTIHYLVKGVEKAVTGSVADTDFPFFFPNDEGEGFGFLRPIPKTPFEYHHELAGFREGMGFDGELDFAQAASEYIQGAVARAEFSKLLFPNRREAMAQTI
jgi:hypothetical protein